MAGTRMAAGAGAGRWWRRVTAPVLLFAALVSPGGVPAQSPNQLPDPAAADRLPVPPTMVGINVGNFATWSGERSLANIAAYGEPIVSEPGRHWDAARPGEVNELGYPSMLPPERKMIYPLVDHPGISAEDVEIRCTWAGKGEVGTGGSAKIISRDKNALTFLFNGPTAWVELSKVNADDPIHDLDCREASTPRSVVFAPAFVQQVKQFPIVRFLNWQLTNANTGGKWAERTRPGAAVQLGPDGVSVENMVSLVNEAGNSPWFLMPYNADAEYVRNFARYVHDHLNAGATVYVELGNELWNGGFKPARQAQEEGLREGLSANPGEAAMRRYAERTIEVMKIWTEVFADRPGSLVRVAATQNAWPPTAEMVLGFRDTAKWVDALATAPYFGMPDFDEGKIPTADGVFARIDESIAQAIKLAKMNKVIAARYGKRFIAYEAGQHLTNGKNTELLASVQRDPRMGEAYTHYLTAWQRQIGDTAVLYSLTGGIGGYGAFGLQERTGQPLGEAPKLRAVQAFIAVQPGR